MAASTSRARSQRLKMLAALQSKFHGVDAVDKAELATNVLAVHRDQQAEREERAREDLKAQAVEFRRRLGALETRVDEIEERLPRD